MKTPQELLTELQLINQKTIIKLAPRVRDRDDVSVLKDETSGLIFLNRMDHIELSHYEEMQEGSYWAAPDREKALKVYAEDDLRRANQFSSLIRDKDYIDIGCGTGGLLHLFRGVAKKCAGVEPQRYMRSELMKERYLMFRIVDDVPRHSFDTASLFHVLEHITTPLETLETTRVLLRKGGKVIIEVPHARDVLLKLKSFQDFSLWSEHIILYTKDALRKLLEQSGYKDIRVVGFQRYPLANHIGWLVADEPGGQKSIQINGSEYEKLLIDTDQTDTIIATASV